MKTVRPWRLVFNSPYRLHCPRFYFCEFGNSKCNCRPKMAEEEFPKSSCEGTSLGITYPMYFGFSCAFLALHLVTAVDRANTEVGGHSSGFGEMMLLLGLLFEKAQKRHGELRDRERAAQLEVMELKRIRTEDAKANEKVMSIFSTREHSWKAERRRLLIQIQFLSRELSIAKSSNEKIVSDLKRRDSEEKQRGRIQDDLFEEEAKKMAELEEKLHAVQKEAAELREKANNEAQDHMSELWRQKTAFMELVSSQRQLEAEIALLHRHAEEAKEELAEIFEQKEEALAMVETLSAELIRLQKDAEQKGKIVSAMLRKGKHDAAEKQALLKEVKLTRARKKQVELEAERWRSICEAKTKQTSREWPSSEPGSSGKNTKLDLRARLLEFLAPESNRDPESSSFEKMENPVKPTELEDWVRIETKKYTAVLEQKHYTEIEAFAEQLRARDEKIDALQWRLLSIELDSKTLQSHIEGLDGSLAQLRDENVSLETLLLERESDLNSLKRHFQRSNPLPNPDPTLPKSFDSLTKATNRKPKASQNLHEKTEVKNIEEIVLLKQFKPGSDLGGPCLPANFSDDQAISRQITAHPSLKMNIQALGISFKIKRLRQQLAILQNLADANHGGDDEKTVLKGLNQAIFLLNKQLKRYQSLEEKTDALCQRMLDNSCASTSRLPLDVVNKERTDKLAQSLEETFQLQRYLVATGQKLMELQPKVESSLTGTEEQQQDESSRFDIGQFLQVVTSLFKDVQRGLEVRIARIIGDVEGTLACDGFLRS